ncbi:alcohol dehydrogenase [Pelomyxa schiedti]|nr:alcohol dehydrogenase [Pelomyxa schiedti]
MPSLGECDMMEMGPEDVEVCVVASGLCHTDCHMAANDWGISRYPLVPGHEGVGKVVAVGSAVSKLKLGQTVGIGWICGSCRTCPNCLKGEENLCTQGNKATIIERTGTFAHRVRISQHFAYPIPANLDPLKAAPLLCAGMTVFAPLQKYVKSFGMMIGIIGIGGLGHMAIKFAHAMGAYVTVYSSSAEKETEATKMGANRFVLCTDASSMAKENATQELIINTSPVPVDWNMYMSILTKGGIFCLVGIPVDNIPINTTDLVFGQKSVVGTIVSGSAIMTQMLDFCAKHQIYPEVEIWDFKDFPGNKEVFVW